jgi:hypothetical protein
MLREISPSPPPAESTKPKTSVLASAMSVPWNTSL